MGMLSAARKEQLKNALFTDFDYQSLEEMLSGPTVDKQIKAYTSENDNLREAVALLVSGAEEEGWTLQLIQGAYEARKAPATEINKWVRRFFAEFAITVEGDSITQVQWSIAGTKAGCGNWYPTGSQAKVSDHCWYCASCSHGDGRWYLDIISFQGGNL